MDTETAALLKKLVAGDRVAHLATLRGGAPMASMTLFGTELSATGRRSSISLL